MGQPQRQAVDDHQRLRAAVLAQRSGQIERLFHRQHPRHALGAVALVARNALAHFIVPRLGSRQKNGAVVAALEKPITRQQFSAARFAAFLAAEDQFAAGYRQSHGVRPPNSAATALGLDANHA